LGDKYGVLRIPFPIGCDVNIDDLILPNVKRYELINFDMHIDGMTSKSYLHIEHKGLPSIVLNSLHSQLGQCIPNIKVVYDNSELLAIDLEEYRELSQSKSVYIVAKDGGFNVVYNNKNQSN
jgi:hypothetical protein